MGKRESPLLARLSAELPPADQAKVRAGRRAGRRAYRDAITRGDWDRALDLAGSEERATVLVEISARVSDEELPALLMRQWPAVDGSGHVKHEILALFQRAGYVNDTGRRLEGRLTVYRGNLGEDPRLGISWTLSRARARFFALHWTWRGPVLGLRRPDGGEPVPTVWRGSVEASEVLGYFGSRRESEVVLDPAMVRDVAVVLRPRRIDRKETRP
jgi:hypothetical protein